MKLLYLFFQDLQKSSYRKCVNMTFGRDWANFQSELYLLKTETIPDKVYIKRIRKSSKLGQDCKTLKSTFVYF